MAVKQNLGNLAPDGSVYTTLTDGAGNLGGITVNTSDIQIGAVEIKDGTTDNRAAVSAGGALTVLPGNTANTTAWLVTTTPSATGTITSVASSASDVTILASNTSRKGMAVYNDSTQILYLACASATSSSSVYTVQLSPGGFFELPQARDGSVYTGVIKGIWASANGNARVTEWT